MSKHDTVKAYFEPKVQELAGRLLFNYSPDEESIGMITDYSDKVVKSFVTGRKRKAYGLSFIIVRPYSTDPGDDLNLEAMNFAQAFMDWIDQQNQTKSFPDMGGDCTVEQIEVLQNMPNLAAVNAEEGIARYMIQCRILYTDDSENQFRRK